MKKPALVTYEKLDLGKELELLPNHKNLATIIRNHNNLVEVVNYLWDHVQSNDPELIDLLEE